LVLTGLALAGTAVGIVIGAAILIPLKGDTTVLWGILPVAVLLGAYAPRVISFAAGQAAFTVVVLVLFNIIQPTGWKVGILRIEDVAVGFAISLGVGRLFWPRGAGALVREDLATAYARAADYVVATTRQLIEGGDSGDAARAAIPQSVSHLVQRRPGGPGRPGSAASCCSRPLDCSPCWWGRGRSSTPTQASCPASTT